MKLELPSVPLGFVMDSLAASSTGSCLLVTLTLLKLCMCLFWAAPGLCGCTLFSRGERGLLCHSPRASQLPGFSCCAPALGARPSAVVALPGSRPQAQWCGA